MLLPVRQLRVPWRAQQTYIISDFSLSLSMVFFGLYLGSFWENLQRLQLLGCILFHSRLGQRWRRRQRKSRCRMAFTAKDLASQICVITHSTTQSVYLTHSRTVTALVSVSRIRQDTIDEPNDNRPPWRSVISFRFAFSSGPGRAIWPFCATLSPGLSQGTTRPTGSVVDDLRW